MTANVNQDGKILNEKDILYKLVVSEEDVLKDLDKLVDKAKVFFKIEKPTGRVLINDSANLTIPKKIAALLIGKYFAARLEIIDDGYMTVTEIGNELGLPRTSISGPLKKLHDKKYIIKEEDRTYKIDYNKIKEIINDYLMPTN